MTQPLSPQPKVIAFEGGPCGGKTTIINELSTAMARADRRLVLLPEAATDYILELQATGDTVEDLATNDRPAYVSFEKRILQRIVETMVTARHEHADTDTLIVTDRADIAAYVTPEEYSTILSDLKLPASPLVTEVDTVFYLPTLARTDPKRYEQLVATNQARFERLASQAIATCDLNLQMVQAHPDVRIYDGPDFSTKIGQVITDVMHLQDAIVTDVELQ